MTTQLTYFIAHVFGVLFSLVLGGVFFGRLLFRFADWIFVRLTSRR